MKKILKKEITYSAITIIHIQLLLYMDNNNCFFIEKKNKQRQQILRRIKIRKRKTKKNEMTKFNQK